jgi:hypothetical protein
VTDVREGDLCSVRDNDMYRVAKILRVDAEAVHIRLYAERFLSRPVAVEQGKLTLGSVHLKAFGIGHLPLARPEFESWEPEVFAHEPIEEDELEGYALWVDAVAEGAGLWGAPEQTLRERIVSLFRWRA